MDTAEQLLSEWYKMVNDENHKHLPVLFGKVHRYLNKPKKKRKYKVTARGFSVFDEFKDSKGNEIRVQMSSAAEKCCCWVFCHGPDGKSAYTHMGELGSYSPHLTKAQAKRLIRGLTKFVEDGV